MIKQLSLTNQIDKADNTTMKVISMNIAMDKQLTFQHNAVPEMGRTCIDCHKGIAHSLPETEDLTLMKN